MKPLQYLKKLALEDLQKKSPNFPKHALPIPNYSDKTANGLTKCIIDFIKFNGGQAERINVISRVVKGKHVKSTMTKGTADISATIPEEWMWLDDDGFNKIVKVGRSVKIEVKIGKDRQSEYQKKYEEDIIKSGGYYYIAKDFDGFFDWYNKFF